MSTETSQTILNRYNWADIAADLNARGWALLPELFAEHDCRAIRSLYDEGDEHFRSRVIMQRHGFGRGEYKYFSYPLPDDLSGLRATLYARLAPIANAWAGRLGHNWTYPAIHQDYLKICYEAGQTRPTPLLLKYEAGDYNCLHQDLYGALNFPLQMAVLLSRPGEEFQGGGLILTEQRPRMQSRPHLIPLKQGDAVIFAVNERPVEGSRGDYRVKLRHGVSEVWAGVRHTLGLIFHDAS
ncbi:2OG-Fe(II) oxygenase [Ponticaulis sp.]|uniref:2OG-Fe(II) oxygenase n=1 Tax=Ponticaulis sp. TaxID=2020902 RepID=UPI000B6821A6|nr:2OG-Fe(II) oxygenase [Ponticaulis sp.]MAI90977.1 proline hydroxylase [Ponticaulis sp.]OUX98318.1 MAG: proline hydroxylase [Hyphomonadaceae bacterium TMED5]|tara:strand:+ start:161630 stop:162349 length:720 start_codon:yes stop_codon:yes gene_type:complete